MAKGRGMPRGDKGMLAQLKRMQDELAKAQEQLATETVEVTAGGGAVRVVMTGTQSCQRVVLSPELVSAGDVEMIQDLIVLAVNQAIHESQVMAARRLGPASGFLDAGGMGG